MSQNRVLAQLVSGNGAATAANSSDEPALVFIKFLSAKEHQKIWEHAGFGPAS